MDNTASPANAETPTWENEVGKAWLMMLYLSIAAASSSSYIYSESDHLVEEIECKQYLEGSRRENANVGHHLSIAIIVNGDSRDDPLCIKHYHKQQHPQHHTYNLNKLLCVKSNEVGHLPRCELLPCARC